MAVWPLSSTFILPTFALPAYSVAITSIVGAIIRQGPHHSAQKSTSTGSGELSTSVSKAASVKFKTLLPAISISPLVLDLAFDRKMQQSYRHPTASSTARHIRPPSLARKSP